jgi:hypothetical protein
MARWRTSFALQSLGGINGGVETGIDEEDRPKKRRAQRGVYRYKGDKDDPVEIIGRWNDQTMVRFDEFISGIRDGTVLEDMEFELFELDKEEILSQSSIMACMLFVIMDI